MEPGFFLCSISNAREVGTAAQPFDDVLSSRYDHLKAKATTARPMINAQTIQCFAVQLCMIIVTGPQPSVAIGMLALNPRFSKPSLLPSGLQTPTLWLGTRVHSGNVE